MMIQMAAFASYILEVANTPAMAAIPRQSKDFPCINCGVNGHLSKECKEPPANCGFGLCAEKGLHHLKRFCFYQHPELITNPAMRDRFTRISKDYLEKSKKGVSALMAHFMPEGDDDPIFAGTSGGTPSHVAMIINHSFVESLCSLAIEDNIADNHEALSSVCDVPPSKMVCLQSVEGAHIACPQNTERMNYMHECRTDAPFVPPGEDDDDDDENPPPLERPDGSLIIWCDGQPLGENTTETLVHWQTDQSLKDATTTARRTFVRYMREKGAVTLMQAIAHGYLAREARYVDRQPTYMVAMYANLGDSADDNGG
jgi:hypothetical protein